MKNKNKSLFLAIGIVSLGLLLTGGTYAWLIFNGVSVGENTLTGNTSSFLVDYTAGLNGLLFPSRTYKGGISGTVTAKINSDSDVTSATGYLYLAADHTTSSILYEGTEMGVALKYVVLDDKGVQIAAGAVNEDILVFSIATGVYEQKLGMLIYDGFKLTKDTTKKFTVYLWLDGNLADNRYLAVSFSGALNVNAIQDEEV